MKNGCCETPISFYMFIKFVAFKMYEQKQNSEHL